MSPFMQPGDILGHEPMGVVEEVGPGAQRHPQPGDRVVVPFNIACGRCWMCQGPADAGGRGAGQAALV